MKMLEDFVKTIGPKLAGDTAVLALAANPLKILLITNSNPEGDSETDPPAIGDLTFPVTAGLTGALALATGAQLESREPETGDIIVQLKTPLGGWRWETSAAPAAPEAVTGIALVSDDDATLFGIQALPQGPVTLDAINQAVDVGVLEFKIPVADIGNV